VDEAKPKGKEMKTNFQAIQMVLLLLLSIDASAKLYLQDVKFADGATATGWVDGEEEFSIPETWDIDMSAGSYPSFPAVEYFRSSFGINSRANSQIDGLILTYPNRAQIQIGNTVMQASVLISGIGIHTTPPLPKSNPPEWGDSPERQFDLMSWPPFDPSNYGFAELDVIGGGGWRWATQGCLVEALGVKPCPPVFVLTGVPEPQIWVVLLIGLIPLLGWALARNAMRTQCGKAPTRKGG
jgi:hypothetical protein